MLDYLFKAFAPLFLIVPRLLGLRLLRDATIETLHTHDELARRAAGGDEMSRALLAKLVPAVTSILDGDAGVTQSISASSAGSAMTPPALGVQAPFPSGGAAPGAETPESPGPDRKKRGRPAKPRAALESPMNGVARDDGFANSSNSVDH